MNCTFNADSLVACVCHACTACTLSAIGYVQRSWWPLEIDEALLSCALGADIIEVWGPGQCQRHGIWERVLLDCAVALRVWLVWPAHHPAVELPLVH